MTQHEFATWVERHYPKLTQVAKQYDGEHYEDLLQDTLLTIWAHKRYRAVAKERSRGKSVLIWVRKILKDHHLNQIRQAMRLTKYDQEAVGAPSHNPSLEQESQIFIEELCAQVSPATRAFILFVLQGGSAKQAWAYTSYMTEELGPQVSYSYYLRQVKAELERVL